MPLAYGRPNRIKMQRRRGVRGFRDTVELLPPATVIPDGYGSVRRSATPAAIPTRCNVYWRGRGVEVGRLGSPVEQTDPMLEIDPTQTITPDYKVRWEGRIYEVVNVQYATVESIYTMVSLRRIGNPAS